VRTSTNKSDESGSPLYVSVAGQLREQIYGGRLAPGQRLETEAKLARRFGVGRATLRSALNLLEAEGLIVKQQGLPSYVRSRRVQQTLARLATLDETLGEQGLSTETRVLAFAFRRPDRPVQAALGLAADDEVLYIHRLHLVDGRPIAAVQLSLPATLAGELSRKDVEAHALYDLLPNLLGTAIGTATQRVRAETATREVAELLQVAEGSALLACERVTSSEDGRPLIHALFQHAGDRFEFVIDVPSHRAEGVWAFPGLSLSRPPSSEEQTDASD
jgi:GntR family transcriptional regulator